MNIMPMNRPEADRKHWVVRWLRYTGFIIVALSTVAGIYYANVYAALLMYSASISLPQWAVSMIAVVVGGLLGFAGGLALSLPWWGVSMVIDDVHAMRQYMQGFVAK